jgi:hypothetical protein
MAKRSQRLTVPEFGPTDRYEEGRRAGLEQAARAADDEAQTAEDGEWYIASKIAKAIRKLADSPEGGADA